MSRPATECELVSRECIASPVPHVGCVCWPTRRCAISRAFPALCVASLALPLTIGWAIGGTCGALLTLLWAGLVRICFLHHVTWSVNALSHLRGSRPFTTRRYDRATNLWPLALLSLGESWHSMHHSDPTRARHGADRGQLDLSAGPTFPDSPVACGRAVSLPLGFRIWPCTTPAVARAG
jgi:Fatty acid desaturase